MPYQEDQYAVLEIWNEYNILEDIKRGPYSKKSPIHLTNQTVQVSQAKKPPSPVRIKIKTDIDHGQNASLSAISSDSSDESVGSPPSRVILFGDIPTVIPSTSVVALETSTIAPVISSVAPVVETTLVASPTDVWLGSPIRGLLIPSDETTIAGTLMLLNRCSMEDVGPRKLLTARRRVGPLPARRLAGRHASPCSSDHRSSSSSSSSDFLPSGLDALDQAHFGSLTRDSSSGDSSERPLHSSSHSAGPSRKRCRSPVDSVTSSMPVIGSLAPTRAHLLPPRKRFRDSYSSEASMEEEDTEIDPIETEVDMELGIVKGYRSIDPMSTPIVEEEIVEPAGEDSFDSSGTRDGIVRGHRVSMIEKIDSLRLENLKVRAMLGIERDRVDILHFHMSLSQEEFRAVRRIAMIPEMEKLRRLESYKPTVIPSTSVVAPKTSTIAPVISSAALVVETTLVASPTGFCGLIPYSGSDFDSLDEMYSPEHISLLPAISPFLCTDSSEAPDFSDRPPSQDPYVMIVARWRSKVASRPSSSSSEFPIAPVTAPPRICRRSAILIRPEKAIPFGRPYRTYLNRPHKLLTARKRVGPLPARRLAWRRALPHVSPRLGYPLRRAPRRSKAFYRSCAAPLSTLYPPTILESSSGDSSERPLHLSLHSVGPSCKRCRSPVDSVPSYTLVMGSLAPTCADLSPPRKRFTDSYSSEASIEEDTEIDPIKTEVDIELGISDGDDVRDHVEIDPRDVRDDTEEYEADTSAGDTVEVGIDPMPAPIVKEEIVEPAGEDSSNSSGTRDGIVRSFEDMLIDLDDVVRDFYHHMSEIRIDRIVGIETVQKQLEAD
ncbi:hypothetical protein Tco_0802552 [Tanacetum coccineum]|uniref:Uncharacterized protein n=1 Tax=Tanacetum coccineum TaxID=301880 RepID=A0ABQ4ZZ45_9ASTR